MFIITSVRSEVALMLVIDMHASTFELYVDNRYSIYLVVIMEHYAPLWKLQNRLCFLE